VECNILTKQKKFEKFDVIKWTYKHTFQTYKLYKR
jgi:hypothetical protein